VLSELRQAVKKADRVYIATDPDREGETIGWHLQQALNLRNPQRVVYSEITPQAVRECVRRGSGHIRQTV
jgi:DNA topoisomerase-1